MTLSGLARRLADASLIHFTLALPKASHPAIAGWGYLICPRLRASSHATK